MVKGMKKVQQRAHTVKKNEVVLPKSFFADIGVNQTAIEVMLLARRTGTSKAVFRKLASHPGLKGQLANTIKEAAEAAYLEISQKLAPKGLLIVKVDYTGAPLFGEIMTALSDALGIP